MIVEHHLEFPSLKGGCRGSSESTLVEMPVVGNHMSQLILLSSACPVSGIILHKTLLLGHLYAI